MKIFISYKQTGVTQEELDKNLGLIKKVIHKIGYKSFIYYLDGKVNSEAKIINKKALENIEKSDLVIGFINHSEKSEGQLLELGMSYSIGKKILILIDKKFENDYFLAYGLKGDIIKYDNIEEIDDLLTNYLKGK